MHSASNVTTFHPQTLATFHRQPINEAKLLPPFTLSSAMFAGGMLQQATRKHWQHFTRYQ